jgi:hypothetical protein
MTVQSHYEFAMGGVLDLAVLPLDWLVGSHIEI